MNRFFRDHSTPLFLLFLGILILSAYLPTLHGEFILDDKPLIQKNPYVHRLQTLISYLSQEDGRGDGGNGGRTGYYRPLIQFTYWLDYRIWGMSGPGFRTSNLFYHFLSSVLFFFLIRRLTGADHASFWVAVLFALHPVNTEAVSWVSSRNNILSALFAVGSFLFYLRARETKRAGWGSLSLLFFACSLLSKEFGLALLPVFLLWTFLVDKERGGEVPVLIQNHLPYLLVLCAYLALRFWVTGPLGGSEEGDDLWRRILFTPYLILVNAQKILLPVDLHSFMVHYPARILSWQSAAGVCFVAFLCFLLWHEKNRPLLRFGLLSFLISLGPILHIVVLPSPSLISMRWLYFPMIFLLAALAPYLKRLLTARSPFATVLLAAVACYFGFSTNVLNRELWHDEEGFFKQEVFHFGNDYYAGGIAEILHQKGDYKGAEEQFLVAIRTGNRSAKDLVNYGALLIDRGRAEEAIPVLQSALALPMSFEERGELHNNLGMAEFRSGRRGHNSLPHFKKAVAYVPDRALFWSNLGSACGSAGDYAGAVKGFGRALEIEPDSCTIRKGMAITLMNMQDYAGALSALEGGREPCDPEYMAFLRRMSNAQ